VDIENAIIKRKSINKPFLFEYVKYYIESEGCKLLSDVYVNRRKKLEIEFACGHVNIMSFECFQRGHRCSGCGHRRISLNRRLPEEEIDNRLSKIGLVLVEFPDGYKSRESLVTCRCENMHIETRKLITVLRNNGCVQCSRKRLSDSRKGKLGCNWQGGLESLISFLKKQIKQWKLDSLEMTKYNCALCVREVKFKDVHHLYSFLNIVKDSCDELKLDKKKTVSEYSEQEIEILIEKIREIHYRYPLGIPLCRIHHKLFHNNYGYYNNTPAQFEEFRQRIQSGDIIIPE